MARIVRSASPADKRRAAQAIKRDILHAVKSRSRRAFQRQSEPEARQRGLTTPRSNKDSFKGNQNQKPASAVSPQRGAQMAKAARVAAPRKPSKAKKPTEPFFDAPKQRPGAKKPKEGAVRPRMKETYVQRLPMCRRSKRACPGPRAKAKAKVQPGAKAAMSITCFQNDCVFNSIPRNVDNM